MINSEENKLDELHNNLIDIENNAKNLDLCKNDNHRFILTDIVDVTEPQKNEIFDNNELKKCLNELKTKLDNKTSN